MRATAAGVITPSASPRPQKTAGSSVARRSSAGCGEPSTKPASTTGARIRSGRVRSSWVAMKPPCENPIGTTRVAGSTCASIHAQIASVASAIGSGSGSPGDVIANQAAPPLPSSIGARSDAHGSSSPSSGTSPSRSRSCAP